ncbi:hypothetical protein R3W88_022313 [Solanum pinnatisectum]|uniref:Reverse transcriptase zinc-binding domain-containing protein n=1 Tax=Solanum pinnatisectum TaxID=50273 RepID=A0AAV9LU95_9SOLN|nr:hypothetical protein R3W88_022313 [Solanum pinnatisectum]
MIRKILAVREILEHTQAIQANSVNIKYIYQKLLGDNPKVSWKSLLFGSTARPKAKFILWLRLQDRLQTIDRLQAWGLDIDQQCKLCQQHEETRDHLFVQCAFVQEVWRRIMTLLQWQWNPTTIWNTHLAWAILCAKGRSLNAQIFKLAYAEITYAIWIERNRMIFENARHQCEEITKEIVYMCNIRATPQVKIKFQQLKFLLFCRLEILFYDFIYIMR